MSQANNIIPLMNRYKTVNRYGLYTKKICCEINKRKKNIYISNASLKSSRFSKKI